MNYSSSDEIEKRIESKYSLVIAVAKRAKQLKDGALQLVECKSRNPITIALAEIAAGKVKISVPSEEFEAEQAYEEAKPGARETAELLRIPTAEELEESSEVESGESNEESADEAEDTEASETDDEEIEASDDTDEGTIEEEE